METIGGIQGREHLAARTDKNGSYKILGIPIGKKNRLIAFTTDDDPYMAVAVDVDTSGSSSVVTHDIQLKKGIWARGRVYDANTDEPFHGELRYYWFRDRELEKIYPGIRGTYVYGRYFTNMNGEFKVPVFPVPGLLAFTTGNRYQERMAPYPRGSGKQELKAYIEPGTRFPRYRTDPVIMMPGNYNRLALVEPKPDDKVVEVDMSMRANQPIAVTVIDADGSEVDRELHFYGGNERYGWRTHMPRREFSVEDLLPGARRKVFAMDREQGLVGGTIVDHESDGPFKIKLAKAGEVHGRIVDDAGDPVSDATISIEYGDFQNDKITGMWADVVGKRQMPCRAKLKQARMANLSSKVLHPIGNTRRVFRATGKACRKSSAVPLQSCRSGQVNQETSATSS